MAASLTSALARHAKLAEPQSARVAQQTRLVAVLRARSESAASGLAAKQAELLQRQRHHERQQLRALWFEETERLAAVAQPLERAVRTLCETWATAGAASPLDEDDPDLVGLSLAVGEAPHALTVINQLYEGRIDVLRQKALFDASRVDEEAAELSSEVLGLRQIISDADMNNVYNPLIWSHPRTDDGDAVLPPTYFLDVPCSDPDLVATTHTTYAAIWNLYEETMTRSTHVGDLLRHVDPVYTQALATAASAPAVKRAQLTTAYTALVVPDPAARAAQADLAAELRAHARRRQRLRHAASAALAGVVSDALTRYIAADTRTRDAHDRSLTDAERRARADAVRASLAAWHDARQQAARDHAARHAALAAQQAADTAARREAETAQRHAQRDAVAAWQAERTAEAQARGAQAAAEAARAQSAARTALVVHAANAARRNAAQAAAQQARVAAAAAARAAEVRARERRAQALVAAVGIVATRDPARARAATVAAQAAADAVAAAIARRRLHAADRMQTNTSFDDGDFARDVRGAVHAALHAAGLLNHPHAAATLRSLAAPVPPALRSSIEF